MLRRTYSRSYSRSGCVLSFVFLIFFLIAIFNSDEKVSFIKELKPVKSNQGDDVILKCEVTYPNKSFVTWFHDNKKVVQNERFVTKEDKGILQLLIKNVKVSEAVFNFVISKNFFFSSSQGNQG